MRVLIICLLLLKAGAAFAHIEKLFFLKGTLGDKPIGMRIEMEDNFWHGEYFFADTKKNIVFKGECDSNTYNLSVYRLNKVLNKEEAVETFYLTENSDHSWNGTWKSAGKELKVELKPIEVSSVPHKFKDLGAVRQLDPYSYLRTSDLEFKEIKTKKINGITVQWLREKVSGIAFIRIKKGLPEAELKKVNDLLTGVHLNTVEGSFWCGSALVEGSYTFDHSISLLNKNVLSLNTVLASDCQGTGVESFSRNLTIDIEKGEEVSFEDLFFAGQGDIPKVNSGQWYNYRYETFGKLIHKMLLELYPEKLKSTEGDCSLNKDEAWQFPQWRLAPQGVYMKASLPDYLQCKAREEFLIPYSKLESIRKRKVQ